MAKDKLTSEDRDGYYFADWKDCPDVIVRWKYGVFRRDGSTAEMSDYRNFRRAVPESEPAAPTGVEEAKRILNELSGFVYTDKSKARIQVLRDFLDSLSRAASAPCGEPGAEPEVLVDWERVYEAYRDSTSNGLTYFLLDNYPTLASLPTKPAEPPKPAMPSGPAPRRFIARKGDTAWHGVYINGVTCPYAIDGGGYFANPEKSGWQIDWLDPEPKEAT